MAPLTRSAIATSLLACGMTILVTSASAAVDEIPPQIRISILVDDKHVLDGHGGYDDAQLNHVRLTPVKEGTVVPNPGAELTATLRGKVVARVSVVMRARAPQSTRDSESKELRLVRDNPEDPWRLHSDDTARIEKETNINKAFEEAIAAEHRRHRAVTPAPAQPAAQPAAPPVETNYWPWVAGGGIALLAVLALVGVGVMRRKPSNTA